MRLPIVVTLAGLALLGAGAAHAQSSGAASASAPGPPGSRLLRAQQAQDRRGAAANADSLAPLTPEQLAATARPSDESEKAVNEEQARLKAIDAQTGDLNAKLDQLDAWLKRPPGAAATPASVTSSPIKRRRLRFLPWRN